MKESGQNTAVTYQRSVLEQAEKGFSIDPQRLEAQSVSLPEFDTRSIGIAERKLTYFETTGTSTEKYRHTFYDEKKNRYQFDAQGRFAGYVSGEEEWTTGERVSYSEEQILDLARQYAIGAFGKRVADFELISIEYAEDVKLYEIEFRQKIGEFYSSERYYAYLTKDGYLSNISLHHAGLFDGLDPDRLEGITEAVVEAHAQENLKQSYPECEAESTLKGRGLCYINRKYYIGSYYDVNINGFDRGKYGTPWESSYYGPDLVSHRVNYEIP